MEFYDDQANFIQNTGLNFWVNNAALFTNIFGFFDPRILYDPKSDKFIATLLYYKNNNKEDSKIVILVSHNGDPSNGWEVFSIDAPAGYWYDYPNIGMSSNDFFITVNQLTAPGAGMLGTDVFQIPKVDLYSQIGFSPLPYYLYDNVVDVDAFINRSICVVTNGAPQINGQFIPYGPGIYLISLATNPSTSKATFYDITDDYAGSPVMNLSSYTYPIGINQASSAFQLGSSNRLDCGSTKIQSAYYLQGLIHFTLNGSTSQANTESSIYYARFDVVNLTGLYQQIIPNTIQNNEEWFAYPSICHMGNSIFDKSTGITYLATGRLLYPEIRTLLYDDNMVPSNQSTFRVGDNFLITNGINPTDNVNIRWGDYTGIQRVYDDPCPRFWISGTFGNTQNEYSAFVSESKCDPTGLAEISIVEKVLTYPNPTSNNVTLEFKSKEFMLVNLTIYSIEGKVVISLTSNIEAGTNKIQIPMSDLSNGVYFLTIKNNNNVLHTQKIIKD